MQNHGSNLGVPTGRRQRATSFKLEFMRVVLTVGLSLGGRLCGDASPSLRVGPVWRPQLRLSCRNGSVTGRLPLPAESVADPFAQGLDDGTEFADRTFIDGYVHRDPGTGNPGSLAPESTWNWGYDSVSQADLASGLMCFSRTHETPTTIREYRREVDYHRDDEHLSTTGTELALNWPLTNGATCRLTAELDLIYCPGFNRVLTSFIPVLFQREQAAVSRYHEIYNYDVSGLVLPESYHGNYAGPCGNPPIDPSLLIPNLPASIERTLENTTFLGEASDWIPTAYSRIRSRWEATTFEVALGPLLTWQPHPRWQAYAGVQAILCYVQGSGSSRAEISWPSAVGDLESYRWRSRGHFRQLLAGVAGRIGGRVDLVDGLFLGAGAVWSGYADKPEWTVGSGRAVLNLSGMMLHIAIGKDF